MDHPGAGRPPLSLHDTARRLGAYVWLEGRAFEVLGSWVPTVPEPAAKVCLATQSRLHGWHAEVWAAAMPAVRGLPREEVVTPATAEVVTFFDALQRAGDGATVARLAGTFRVLLPRLVAAYSSHLAAVSAVSDAGTAHWLQVVLRDEVEHWRAGETVLQSLVADPATARQAASVQGELEALLVAGGGLVGVG